MSTRDKERGQYYKEGRRKNVSERVLTLPQPPTPQFDALSVPVRIPKDR